MNNCEILTPDLLNLSDNLLISVFICVSNITYTHSQPTPSKSNWSKERKDGSIDLYTSKVQPEIIPLLQTTLLSISKVETEIKIVVEILTQAASEYLPYIKPKKKKTLIIGPDPKVLCKQSKAAWIRWKNAGCPSERVLWYEMKESKRATKKHITACRPRKERAHIQKHDLLFKDSSNYCFQVMK